MSATRGPSTRSRGTVARRLLALAAVIAGTAVAAVVGPAPAGAAPSAGAIPAGTVRTLQVGGRAGVPVDAVAAVLNVTVTNPASAGYLTVFPCGADRPLASNLNYSADQTVPNLVIAKLGVGGLVCLFAQQTTDVVADVAGWFPAGSGYTPVPNPTRVLDTRTGTGAPPTPLAAGGTLELVVGGVAGVPGDALATVLNMTVTDPGAAGYLTVWPCGTERPLASNLNYVAGQTVPNLVIARLGTAGRVCVYSQAPTHVIADVGGWFPAASGYVPIANPSRVLDTRTGTGAPAAPLAAGATLELTVGGVAADALAAVLNVTVTGPVGPGFLTVWPCGGARPLASNLNYVAGQTVPNLVIARLGTAGKVCISSLVTTDVVADVGGWFPAGGAYVAAATPTRILDTREAVTTADVPTGQLVVKGSSYLSVIDVATGQARQRPATSSNIQYGPGVSRNGYLADVWDDNGNSTWRITIQTLAGAVAAEWTVGGPLASARSSAVLDAGATRIAYGVNELTSLTNSTRIDRVYVYDTATGTLVARLDDYGFPAFVDTGELLVQREGRLYVFDAQFAGSTALPIAVTARDGSYSASPDGRYIAYENGSRIDAYDRVTGAVWAATDLGPRAVSSPVFSPDGRWLGVLRAGVLALRYAHVIPFEPGGTWVMDDTTQLRSPLGDTYPGANRIGWAR